MAENEPTSSAGATTSRKIGMTKPGDRVRLISGGPVMTVERVNSGFAHCAWFVEGELRTATISTEALVDADRQ